MEEEVLDKYRVENSKRGAFRGGGSPLEWRRVRRSKKLEYGSGERIVGQESSHFSEKRQQTMTVMKDMTKKFRSKEWMDAENRWCVAEILSLASCRMGRHHAKMVLLVGGEEEGRDGKYGRMASTKKVR